MSKEKEYVVVHDFKDLKDAKNTIYRKGDTYKGDSSETRIAELTSEKNAIGQVLIAEKEFAEGLTGPNGQDGKEGIVPENTEKPKVKTTRTSKAKAE